MEKTHLIKKFKSVEGEISSSLVNVFSYCMKNISAYSNMLQHEICARPSVAERQNLRLLAPSVPTQYINSVSTQQQRLLLCIIVK